MEIFVGIDLSYKSTGITIYNQSLNEMVFYRVVSDKPKPLSKINTIRYSVPYNFKFTDNVSDEFTLKEKEKSLKSIMCVRTIIKCIHNYISKLESKPTKIVFGLEAHLMPVINGTNQFQGLSGLIGLNYILREHIIMYGFKNNIPTDLCILSPSEIKKVFTGNGRADKFSMFDAFMNNFEGKKLFGNINSAQHVADYNDLIDSFAILYNTIYRTRFNSVIPIKQKKKKKSHKKQNNTKNIWELSL